ncbi:hypothetical protein [Haladaptatus sp. T7]|uniref:hypothetical protein n=1 Tax=Haladaptatus sp. T7 TaxID=2029368 RepID=UPI002231BCAE|nr:hypothetical protein [Haladaptatus sp. T7]
MPFQRRNFMKTLLPFGATFILTGCSQTTPNNGVRLTRIRLVSLKEFDNTDVRLTLKYDGNEIINKVYTVKHEDGVKAQPTVITDLPKKPGDYELTIENVENGNKSAVNVGKLSPTKCSYVDVLIHDSNETSIYVEKCGE